MSLENQQFEKLDNVTEQFSGVLTESTMEAQKTALSGLSQQGENKENKENPKSAIEFNLGMRLIEAERLIINKPQLDKGNGEIKINVVPVKGTRRGGVATVRGDVRPQLLEFLKEQGKFDVIQNVDSATKAGTLQTGKLTNDQLIMVDGNTVPLIIEYTLQVPEHLIGTLRNADGTPFRNSDGSYYEEENGILVKKLPKVEENLKDTASKTAKGSSENITTTISNRINMALSSKSRDIPENYGAYIQLVDDVKADRSLTEEGRKAALKALAEKYPKGEVEYKFREYKKENPNEGNK